MTNEYFQNQHTHKRSTIRKITVYALVRNDSTVSITSEIQWVNRLTLSADT